MDSLLRIFPQKRRDFWKETAEKGQEVCEIRLRVDRPVIIETKRRELFPVSYTHLTLLTRWSV